MQGHQHYLFTSSRLGFRNWQPEDLLHLAEMNADEKVMKFFPNVLSFKESKKMMEKQIQHFEKYGYGFFVVETLNEEFIGCIGFQNAVFESKFNPCIEIGWRLRKEYWGNGYATEGAMRCLEYGFEVLGFEQVYSFTTVSNTKSERIMKKIGLAKLGEFAHSGIEQGHKLRQHVLYKTSSPLSVKQG